MIELVILAATVGVAAVWGWRAGADAARRKQLEADQEATTAADAVDDDVARLPDADVLRELRDKWQRL